MPIASLLEQPRAAFPVNGVAPSSHRDTVLLPMLVCLAAALTMAAPNFGNPVIHVDEEFYHLVGGRMLDGALPYVDIWDRKPLGLFLIYAAAYAIGGGSVWVYQLAASVSVGLTAFLIYRLALAIAPPAGALCAAVSYVVWLQVFNCAGGQSPVFYNGLMTAAAACVLTLLRRTDGHRAFWIGCGAMLLCGLALQIKYSVIFESVVFGLAIVLADLRCNGLRVARIIAWASCWLFPTAAILIFYAVHGQAAAFVQANFLSIFNRAMLLDRSLARLAQEAALLLPFLTIMVMQARRRAPWQDTTLARFFHIWALAAVTGFLAVGTYFAHYLAPVLVPLCVLVSPSLAREGKPSIAGLLVLVPGFAIGLATIPVHWHERGTVAELTRLTKLIEARKGNGCIYVNEGDAALYETTRSCLPTRFTFPDHLSSETEAKALGAEPVAEIRRIVAKRPSVILVTRKPGADAPNFVARHALFTMMAHDYRPYAEAKLGQRDYIIYALVRTP